MYYPPFLGAIKAEVGSIMCSYNRINGNYSVSTVPLQAIRATVLLSRETARV